MCIVALCQMRRENLDAVLITSKMTISVYISVMSVMCIARQPKKVLFVSRNYGELPRRN